MQGREASEEELLIIGGIRVNIAELSAEEKSELGPWLPQVPSRSGGRAGLRGATRKWEEGQGWAGSGGEGQGEGWSGRGRVSGEGHVQEG